MDYGYTWSRLFLYLTVDGEPKMIPFKALAHFLAWLIVPSIFFLTLHDIFYWYAVIGSLVVLFIYYYTFFGRRMFFPAIGGWVLAFLMTFYIL